VFEQVCDFLICGDVYVKVVHFVFLVVEGGGVVRVGGGGLGPGVVLLYSASESGNDGSGDIVAMCHVCYKLSFPILLLFAQWECV